MTSIITIKRLPRLAIWFFGIISIMGLLIYVVTYTSCRPGFTTERSFTFGLLKIFSKDVPIVRDSLLTREKEYERQLSVLDTMKVEDQLLQLQDTIDVMKSIRQRQLRHAKALLKQFKSFSTDTYAQQQDLLTAVYQFLAEGNEPTKDIDFGIAAREMMHQGVKDSLHREIVIRDQIIRMRDQTILSLRGRLNSIDAQYQNALAELETVKGQLHAQQQEATKDQELIADLKRQQGEWNHEKDSLQRLMTQYCDIRLKNCAVMPTHCRSRRDGSYSPNRMDSLRITFTPIGNTPSASELDTVWALIVLPLRPGLEHQADTIWKRIPITLGKPVSISFKKSNYKYIPGVYTTQIFHEKTSMETPIAIAYLVAKK